MATPMVAAMMHKGSGGVLVEVRGRFGGGYSSPGHSAADAAAMVLRDAPSYDCGEQPINIALCPEVAAEIEAALARGAALAPCIGCKLRK